jgi:hypothetical protein
MDFGARPAFNATVAPVPDATLRLAWFERSSTEKGEQPLAAGNNRLSEGGGVLDQLREADGLVYNGEEDYEL